MGVVSQPVRSTSLPRPGISRQLQPSSEPHRQRTVRKGPAVVYFTMSEENVRKKMTLPWLSFCSDSASLAPEGVFLKSNTHPRAYGSFARLLGKYVREEKVIPLEEAVRKLAALPCQNLKIGRRGTLREEYYADVAVFAPKQFRTTQRLKIPTNTRAAWFTCLSTVCR